MRKELVKFNKDIRNNGSKQTIVVGLPRNPKPKISKRVTKIVVTKCQMMTMTMTLKKMRLKQG